VIFSQLPKWLATPKGMNWWHSLMAPEAWQLTSLTTGAATALAMVYAPKVTTKIPAVIVGLGAGIVTYWLLGWLVQPSLLNLDGNPFIIGRLSADLDGLMQAVTGPWTSILGSAMPHWEQVLVPAITLAVLLSIDTLKTCLVLDALTGSRHNSNKELIGQGLGNLASTLLGGAPGAGTMGATLVNKASGGTTFMSGVFQGLWAMVAVALLTPLIAWVPVASLAALLVVIGYRMIDWHSLSLLKSRDTALEFLVILSVVVVANTVSLIAASGLGVGLAILMFISEQVHASNIRRVTYGHQTFSKRVRTHAERAVLEQEGAATSIIELQGSLFFGTTDRLLQALDPHLKTAQNLVLDFHRVQSLDFTAGHMLERVEKQMKERGAHLILSRMPSKTVTGKDLQTYIGSLGLQNSDTTHMFNDFSDALQWVEDQIIDRHRAALHEDTVMALEEFELFAGMKPSDLALLKTVASEEIYQKDDRIIETGAPGRGLFLIAQGQVKISLRLANGQTHHVTTLGRGQIFGEMSFLDDARYSADGHASEHTELIVIEKQQFMQTVEQHPAIFATMLQRIGLGLAARLRHTNDELRNLVEA
jgi:SulP family sulfate permease